MGVTGLTTYLSKFGGKYSESIYVRKKPVVVDGCNLMFFLYFNDSIGKLSPHLFGGDLVAYCQSIREFFLKLKLSEISPIVIFDGAYESAKLRTAMKRFAKSVKDNVQNKIPGKTYTSALIKVAFLEILVEQNIDHYQTEFEADDTVAFVAKKLNCPVLSSDSDFFVYVNLTTIPLSTIDFRRVQLKKKDQLEKQGLEKNSKPFFLVGKFVTLREICQKEFKLSDCRFLSLIAVVIGNDQVTSRIFSKFQNQRGGLKVNRHDRISFLLKWFGRQPSVEVALQTMLASVKEADRENVKQLVNQVVSNYMGNGGEEYVWQLVKLSKNFQTHCNEMVDDEDTTTKSMSSTESGDIKCCNNNTTTTKATSADKVNSLCDLLQDNLALTEQDGDNDYEPQSEDDSWDDDDNEEVRIEQVVEKPKLPEWYLKSHSECVLFTYLLKLFYNRAIFLTPQVELTTMPSSHAVCVQIIQVTGGIVCGPGPITLITRDKSNIEKLTISTVTSLQCCDLLPCVNILEGKDFRLSLSHEKRLAIFLEALLMTPRDIEFISEWPPYMKFWITTCLYYVRRLKKTRGFYMAIAVALSVIMSCLKNYSFLLTSSASNQQQPNVKTKQQANEISSNNNNDQEPISRLLKSQVMDSKLVKLFKRFDILPEIRGKGFWNSYDIGRVFYFSQYQSVIFHAFMLNNLLGHPLRPPKVSTLNSHIVYNLCTTVVEKYCGQITQFVEKELDSEWPLKKILLRFLHVAIEEEPITVCDMPILAIDQDRKSSKKRDKNRSRGGAPDGKLNRFMVLATDE